MIKTKLDIIYCCMDCGNLICKRTALYGLGRCKVCANLGELNPVYGISKFGKNNSSYKKGLPRCLDCDKELTDYRSKRCEKCFSNNRKDKPRGGNPRFGKDAPSYKDGRSIKDNFCIDCDKLLAGYKSIRCYKCWITQNIGENNGNYIHGQGYAPYPMYFNNALKNIIKERDNFECQNCGITEIKHEIKFKQKLHIHHIDYNKQNCKHYNLITTCQKCNIKANGNRDYWFVYYTYIMEYKE